MADPTQTSERQDPEELGHEPDVINFRAIGIFVVFLVVLCISTFAVLGGAMRLFAVRDQQRLERKPPLFTDESGLYPEPRIQEAPSRDMLQMRAEVTQRLTTYEWIDQEAGVARIPIERAITLTAQRGLPVRPDALTIDEIEGEAEAGVPPTEAAPLLESDPDPDAEALD